MKALRIRVIPNARKNRVLEEEGQLKVYLTAPPAEGKANKALIELLADHFKVKKSSVRIVKGEKSRNKVVEIEM
ncbi:MAG: DUF167 domain-containing protein [Dehalococcoidia bacterium]